MSYQDALARVISEVIAPAAADVDRSGEFPRRQVVALGEAGLLSLTIPAELGGGGGLRAAACRWRSNNSRAPSWPGCGLRPTGRGRWSARRSSPVMAPTTEALHDFIGRALCGLPLLGDAPATTSVATASGASS